MATNLEEVLDMIDEGLQEEAREQLQQQGAVQTGFLRDSIKVTRNGDDFVVSFADYGVFIDEGSGSNPPRPFYSNLVLSGPAEGTEEDEIMEMLEAAFEMDVQELEEEFNE